MNEIMKHLRKLRGNKKGNKKVTILCYADDAVLAKDDLLRLLYQFKIATQEFNSVIAVAKTKSVVSFMSPIRCKLVVENIIITYKRK